MRADVLNEEDPRDDLAGEEANDDGPSGREHQADRDDRDRSDAVPTSHDEGRPVRVGTGQGAPQGS